jgi:hypothetical protein
LLRSSNKIIAEFNGVTLGVDPNVLTNGSSTIDDVIDWIDKPSSLPLGVTLPDKLVLPEDILQRDSMLSALRRSIMNGPFWLRLVAARTLGTFRDLENAPALIFALSDPDYRVAKAARDSLRFVSRKPEGFGFKGGNEPPEKAVWAQAQADWTSWLLSVKPNAELIQ